MKQRGKLLLAALEAMAEVGVTTMELIEVLATSPYGLPYGKLNNASEEKRLEREKRKRSFQQKREVYNLVYRLQQMGLIKKERNKWELTSNGKGKLQKLKSSHSPLPPKLYSSKNDKEWKIIMFDIPEKYRRKRDWVRSTVRHLGFQMLQKSVWIGKVQVPEQFLKDLEELDILSYVEILAITKSGTIEKLRESSNSRS
ncbi:MAG: CRISPR-associated endonuclease Cas2 [Patescibacteria group bacterium]